MVVDDEKIIEVDTDKLRKFQTLIENMKIKFHDVNTSRNEKFQILTLIPKIWFYDDVRKYFQVPKYMFTLSRKLQNKNGILSVPNSSHKGIEEILNV